MPELREYQLEAVAFLTARSRATVLAHVGAGKTAMAIKAMEAVGGRWLVLAPKRVATDVWPLELVKWCTRFICNMLPRHDATPLPGTWWASDGLSVQVMNYEMIHKLTDLSAFDGVVFDELTRLKDPSGKRFKMLEKLLNKADVKYRWGLTGSFTSNGLEDVFGQCKIVDQKLLGRSKGAFLQQYFVCINREYGEWVPATGALEQVMARIKPATFVLEAAEYADTLPPLHMVEVACKLTNRAPYDAMKRDMVVELGGEPITALSAASVTQKLQQGASGFFYRTTKTASDKAGKWDVLREAVWFSPHKFDRLDELLQENQRANTIIIYNFAEELAELKRRYPRAAMITDDNAVARWNAGEIELLLLHPKSAGHGLNLQFGGCTMVFVSLPQWSLELFEQTIGRLHRGGQKHAVWCYLLLTENSIDARMLDSLRNNRSISDVAMEELKGT